jgi:hypothetical protein
MGRSLFQLVYGMEVTFPVHLNMPIHDFLQHYTIEKKIVQARVNQFIEWDEN